MAVVRVKVKVAVPTYARLNLIESFLVGEEESNITSTCSYLSLPPLHNTNSPIYSPIFIVIL